MKTEFENDWRTKSIESLEQTFWPDIRYDEESYLVGTCHKLRKKPLQEFKTEDLRIMIGQDIGTKYLMPLAIEKLTADLFAEGDFYPGDLLKMVLHIDKKFWLDNPAFWDSIANLISGRQEEIESHGISTDLFYTVGPKSSR